MSQTSNASAQPAPPNNWQVPASSKALFCPMCSSIMALPDADNVCKCYDCPYTEKLTPATGTRVQVQIKRYDTSEDAAAGVAVMNPTMRRAKVKEPCPNCQHPELRFYTMQMRSVDEGQTVFYECEKCGHTYSTNT